MKVSVADGFLFPVTVIMIEWSPWPGVNVVVDCHSAAVEYRSTVPCDTPSIEMAAMPRFEYLVYLYVI